MNNPIRVFVVDDHPLFHAGIVAVLDKDPTLTVVGEAFDGRTALAQIRSQIAEIDVVLMDIHLPHRNGLQVTQTLHQLKEELKIIILTGYDDMEQRIYAIRAGAVGYCLKSMTPATLIQTIRKVWRGYYAMGAETITPQRMEAYLTEQIQQLGKGFVTAPEYFLRPMTEREYTILHCVTVGMSNKEIGYHLKISHQTVKNHITSILRKLAVADRTQAAVYALNRGWFKQPDSV